MIKFDIGANSGIVWRLLSEKGSLTFSQLKEATGFDDQELMLALGWLSRENKVTFSHKNEEIVVSLDKFNFYF